MKNLASIILFIACTIFISQLQAQDTSTYPVKNVNGVEYYVYQVQAGEGLYSISKRFNVSQSDINNANPQIYDGLQAGQNILIPVTKTNKNFSKPNKKNTAPTNYGNYIQHKVEKKQTLFAISRMYGVSQDDILKANPQVSDDGLKTGEIILVPQKTASNKPTEEKPTQPVTQPSKISSNISNVHIGDKEVYVKHIVEPQETLYSLSKKYNVSIDDIVKLNPGSDKVLKSGEEISIPNNENTTASTSKPNTSNDNANVQKKTDSYNIAFLLPFMLNEKKKDPTVNKFLDFYMGALLAVKNNHNTGINYNIFTFDTEKDESSLYDVLNKAKMQDMDLIIGPAYTNQIPILADFAKRRKIYAVVPFSSNVDELNNNPYLFEFNPSKQIQSMFLLNQIKNKFSDANIILATIDNDDNDEDNYFDYIGKKLGQNNIPYRNITKSDIFTNKIANYLVSGKKNIIIFNSNELSHVQPYLTDLYNLRSRYDINVVGQYAWKGASGKRPNMYYVSPFVNNSIRNIGASDYESKFTSEYNKLRGSDNPRFDLIGYDLTNYFLSLISKNGFNISRGTKELNGKGIQSDLYFKRVNDNGGFMNLQLYLNEDAAKSK